MQLTVMATFANGQETMQGRLKPTVKRQTYINTFINHSPEGKGCQKVIKTYRL